MGTGPSASQVRQYHLVARRHPVAEHIFLTSLRSRFCPAFCGHKPTVCTGEGEAGSGSGFARVDARMRADARVRAHRFESRVRTRTCRLPRSPRSALLPPAVCRQGRGHLLPPCYPLRPSPRPTLRPIWFGVGRAAARAQEPGAEGGGLQRGQGFVHSFTRALAHLDVTNQ